jgi:hypothetical protein
MFLRAMLNVARDLADLTTVHDAHPRNREVLSLATYLLLGSHHMSLHQSGFLQNLSKTFMYLTPRRCPRSYGNFTRGTGEPPYRHS